MNFKNLHFTNLDSTLKVFVEFIFLPKIFLAFFKKLNICFVYFPRNYSKVVDGHQGHIGTIIRYLVY